MIRGYVARHVQGVFSMSAGSSYTTILRYFFPELISAFVLYSALNLVDALFVADLRSTTAMATLGAASSILHFVFKIAEAVAGSITVLCGQFNGAGLRDKVGQSFVDAFWVVIITGALIAGVLYFGAYYVYVLLGVPEKMIALGIPFLRVRAIGLLLTFVYFACIAFMRSLKNTKTPMQIFLIGACCFIFFDYALIFGAFGFPQLGLLGSAWATLIQYAVMFSLAIGYVLFNKAYAAYGIALFKPWSNWQYVINIAQLSWPMIIDKATMAAAYAWLCAMVAPMGKYVLASNAAIVNMERLAFLPAIACAQIITFLVSNGYGNKDWEGIAANIKRVIILAAVMVLILQLTLCAAPEAFVGLFDHKHKFTAFASTIFPLLSALVFFDLLQLIFSSALRGAGDVRMVMWTRLLVIVGFFCPVSYFCSRLALDNVMKFWLIYAIFYASNGLMSFVYFKRFAHGLWKRESPAMEDHAHNA